MLGERKIAIIYNYSFSLLLKALNRQETQKKGYSLSLFLGNMTVLSKIGCKVFDEKFHIVKYQCLFI